jgi:hypothetical protein
MADGIFILEILILDILILEILVRQHPTATDSPQCYSQIEIGRSFAALRMTGFRRNGVILSGGEAEVEESLFVFNLTIV